MRKIFLDKKVISWCLYDWANSAFALTVMAAFFPSFFKGYWSLGVDSAISTARLGFGNATAGIIVAILSPILGAVAGVGKNKKKFFIFFIYLGVLATASLCFISKGAWITAIIVFIFARIGFSIANLFYDSFLSNVAELKQQNMVSSLGYALGYLGCGLLFALNLLMYNKPEFFGVPSEIYSIKLSFFLVAIWWLVFSIPIIVWVKDRGDLQVKRGMQIYRDSVADFLKTFKTITSNKKMLLFLLAYWFYIDGVYTVVMMATDFGLSIGIKMGTLMTALLIVQFIAFPATILFGKLSYRIGTEKTILMAIAIYIIIATGGAWVLKNGTHFLIFASITGIAQGTIQALSRSYFCSLVPIGKETEFFGFYNMTGRFALVLGPAIVAITNITLYTTGIRSQLASRIGISSLSILFIIGAFFLIKAMALKSEPNFTSI